MKTFLRLNVYDWLVLMSVLMFTAAHTLTNIMVGKLSTLDGFGSSVQAVATVVEANPVAATLLMLGQQGIILRYLMIPAFAIGFYMVIRRRSFADQKDKELALSSYAFIVFMLALLNVINDFGVFLGYFV